MLDNPQIAVVVLVEHGGFGGFVAAPIAKQIYEAAIGPHPAIVSTPTADTKESDLED